MVLYTDASITFITDRSCYFAKIYCACQNSSSEACQKSHWTEHKTRCKEMKSLYTANSMMPKSTLRGRKTSVAPSGGSSKIYKPSNKILFPYEEFLKFFTWDKPGYPPCGLINCGNSCFANVVLQCLAYTRPLVAYLLEKGHRRECQRDDWCFLCEFQLHMERASRSVNPFSPMNILSRLPNIGGNLGYGKQEDAHEFMRFAIDMMQSVCLDEFGGEKVICTECNNVSNQFENMMDLTVEIHGDAGSMEECLDQFTAKERLHGDNMYKCDGCNAYVMAWKRLTVQRAPNILTIALKRFQSGRFGKLNKRVTFPETLDLSPYMSELEDRNDVYKLYAVIVHVDMLNASFFGHYICYIKDFHGKWYRIDDCKVASVDLDEVLSQGAYMLLYSRMHARPSCLLPTELLTKEESEKLKITEVNSSMKQHADSSTDAVCTDSPLDLEQPSTNGSGYKVNSEEELSLTTATKDAKGDTKMASPDLSLPIVSDAELHNKDGLPTTQIEVPSTRNHGDEPDQTSTSLVDASSTESDTKCYEASSSTSDVQASCGNEVNSDLGSSTKLTEASTAVGNCKDDVDSRTCSVPAMDTTSKVLDKENSASLTSNDGNIGHDNGSSSSGDNKKSMKKADGGSSSEKCKPLFRPGFFGKPPLKKLNNHTNEAAHENGGWLKEKIHITHENGDVSTESNMRKSLVNGDSASGI
ncbi:hypothetical protein SASPL_153073 [Salvia splendens]|uniref:USP domain-containing protein n=1 Tax=Salvia splendens TaxID=180675 RepID=A0A8X8W4B9_SALSN|nr:hypothetical protein SASPL_153073 [Salvia splendens]